MKSIAVFNNKGGVGKTTFLCNIAGYLALERGKKVLIIDADPQCNATEALFSEDRISEIYDDSKSFTLYSIVRPLSIGKGYSEKIVPRKSGRYGLDVLVGDPKLALAEDVLARDWGQAVAGDTRGMRTSMLFIELVRRCAEYDIVFFDVGPSLGALNRAVLIACQHYITPMSIDIFSLKALDNIAYALNEWKGGLNAGLAALKDPDEVPDPHYDWNLKFSGYVTQQYTAKKDAQGQSRAVSAYEKIMSRIPAAIGKNLVDPQMTAQEVVERFSLGSIPTLHSLVPMSQTSRAPIFALKSSDGVVGAHFQKVREVKDTYEQIADKLVTTLA
ncbi:MAG: ParA family protein [Caulobacterales bacterium]|nr:ParA family protein [Caulobacterales bacterium]